MQISSFNNLSVSLSTLSLNENFTSEELEKAYQDAKNLSNKSLKLVEESYNYLKSVIESRNKTSETKPNDDIVLKIPEEYSIIYDKEAIDNRIINNLLDTIGPKNMIKRKAELKSKLRNYDSNSNTAINYFSMCNEYLALKTYFDSESLDEKKSYYQKHQ